MSAAATARGYWRICNSLGDFPSNLSRPSSTYSSSRRASIKDGDHRSRGGRGNRRTNGPRSNIPAPAFRRCVCRSRATSVRGPREERDLSAPTLERGWAILSRATFDARAWALLGLATRPPHLTASRPVPSFGRRYHANLRAFRAQHRQREAQLSGMRYPERNQRGACRAQRPCAPAPESPCRGRRDLVCHAVGYSGLSGGFASDERCRTRVSRFSPSRSRTTGSGAVAIRLQRRLSLVRTGQDVHQRFTATK